MPTPSIIGVKPVLSQILVEMLTANEATNSLLHVSEDSDYGAKQGYILAMGPSLKPEECGFKVGDRVMLQGQYIPVPNYDNAGRKKGVVEIHNIKGVLLEETM